MLEFQFQTDFSLKKLVVDLGEFCLCTTTTTTTMILFLSRVSQTNTPRLIIGDVVEMWRLVGGGHWGPPPAKDVLQNSTTNSILTWLVYHFKFSSCRTLICSIMLIDHYNYKVQIIPPLIYFKSTANYNRSGPGVVVGPLQSRVVQALRWQQGGLTEKTAGQC